MVLIGRKFTFYVQEHEKESDKITQLAETFQKPIDNSGEIAVEETNCLTLRWYTPSMAVIPSFGQFQNSFHSVETILGIPKDIFCKQDIISRRLKDTFTERDSSNNAKRQAEVRTSTMKSSKGIGKDTFLFICLFI